MEIKPILIVDDEKNIRFTMKQSLESMGIPVQVAINGEEALEKLRNGIFGIVFLDLKMPGLNGLDVLRQIGVNWPEIRVIIITAHGTIDIAVEAMKLGAVDFIQKPFSPYEIRGSVELLLKRRDLDEANVNNYQDQIEITRRYINERNFSIARESVRKAIAMDPGKPEAYNLLGVLLEIGRKNLDAQRFYRAALNIDPSYKPAADNLRRSTSWKKHGKINLGLDREDLQIDNNNKENSYEK